MQVHNTTGTCPKVPEDDGRSLLARDQYHREMNEIGRLNPVEERNLADRARDGNKEAKELLIENCLQWIYAKAHRYIQVYPELDLLDIAQAGNLEVIEHLPEALKARNVCAFLGLVARSAMVEYCLKDRVMPVPRRSLGRGCRAPLVVSLMAPLSYDSDLMMLDLVEETMPTPSDVQDVERRDRRAEDLYKALRRLPLENQMYLRRVKDLNAYEPVLPVEGQYVGKSPNYGRSDKTMHEQSYRALRSDALLRAAVGVEVAQ